MALQSRTLVILAAATIACLATAATGRADDEPPRFKLGGFGSLGAAYHGSDGLEYRRVVDQPYGARGGRLDPGLDSVLGVQLNARLTEQFDAVIQAISRRHSDNTWDPGLSWAFLRFSPDESLHLRVGRLGVDSQLNGDSRLIGYSNLAVRPSPELFGANPQDYVDGIDIAWRHPVGETLLSAKAIYGYQAAHVHSNGRQVRIPSNDVGALILGAMHGGLQLRFVYGAARVKNNGDAQALVDGLRATGMAQAVAAAARLDNAGRMTQFGAADAGFDHGPLRLLASVFWQTAPEDAALLVDTRTAYFLAGYRIRAWTPYVTAARTTTSGVSLTTGLPPGPALTPLDQAATAAVSGAQFNQRTAGVGVRWDFAPDRALKFQVDRVHAGLSPVVRDLDSPPRDQRNLTLFSATLDFVF